MLDDILRDLIDRIPGARGAIFCDSQGESVSAVGASGRTDVWCLNDYDLRCAGAQFATPLGLALDNATDLGPLELCTIAGGREKLVIAMLPDRYYVVVCLEPDALTGRAVHHLRLAAELLGSEI
jgi:predicted regulator of Ras-like GTPase activity (Roadblock/LC7/MglB family)